MIFNRACNWALFVLLSSGICSCLQSSTNNQSPSPTDSGTSVQPTPSPPASIATDYSANPCLALGPDASTSFIPSLGDSPTPPPVAGLGEGSDLEFGGYGSGQGKFTVGMKNMAFDSANNVYVLDGVTAQNGTKIPGNYLVQKFTNNGVFISQFSIWDSSLGSSNDPSRIAVDSLGQIYITQDVANLVEQYSPSGTLIRKISVPSAFAITVRIVNGAEEVDVIGSEFVPNSWVPFNQISVINPTTGVVSSTIDLSQPLTNVVDMTSDSSGNFYILAAPYQIYKFDPNGRLIGQIGGSTNPFINSVSVDAEGFVYTMTPGNPGYVTKIDPTWRYMIQRPGEFAWNDAWSMFYGYTPMAIDHNGRLWVAVTIGNQFVPIDPNTYNNPPNGLHYRPVVLRTQAEYMTPLKAVPNMTVKSTLSIGLNADLQSTSPISFTPGQPISIDFVSPAGNRLLQSAVVLYEVHDLYKNSIASGQLPVSFQNGIEAKQSFSFTPSKYGWYSVSAHVCQGGQRISSLSKFYGVTPRFPNMPTALSSTDTLDTARSMFVGLPSVRYSLATASSLDALDSDVTSALQLGATVFVQLVNDKNALSAASLAQTEANVTAALNRFKGRVKYWELFNEPNNNPATWVDPTVLASFAQFVHNALQTIDPSAKVLGPSTVGVDLGYITNFFNAGGAVVDIVSVHDYEGNESIDPNHWRSIFGGATCPAPAHPSPTSLRDLICLHDSNPTKPIWQTERGMMATRGNNFTGIQQASRMALHYDLLESFGIPTEHDLNFYLDADGFNYPSYIWSSTGPFPAAMVMRTRRAMTLGRSFSNTIDFGPTGNKLFFGLNFVGSDGSTVILRNLGTFDENLPVHISSGSSVTVVDAFGNSNQVEVKSGLVNLSLKQLPIYVQLAPGQTLSVDPINFGTNIASQAQFSYSGSSQSPTSYLNDGIFASSNAADRTSSLLWVGSFDNITPQSLDIHFASPRNINAMILYGVPPDNNYSQILDFDIQALENNQWVTVQQVRTSLPLSEPTTITDAIALEWLQDTDIFVQSFPQVTTTDLRILVLRTTKGNVAPDSWMTYLGQTISPALQIKEIEVY